MSKSLSWNVLKICEDNNRLTKWSARIKTSGHTLSSSADSPTDQWEVAINTPQVVSQVSTQSWPWYRVDTVKVASCRICDPVLKHTNQPFTLINPYKLRGPSIFCWCDLNLKSLVGQCFNPPYCACGKAWKHGKIEFCWKIFQSWYLHEWKVIIEQYYECF